MTTKLGVLFRTKDNHIVVSTVRTSENIIMKLVNFTGSDDDWRYGRSRCYPLNGGYVPIEYRIVETLGIAEECPHVFL